MTHILIINFNNNPNIGLYAFATDDYCLVGNEVPSKDVENISKVLGVPVHRVTICGTSLIGVFCAGNSKKLLVPGIVFDTEKEKLHSLGIDFEVIETKMTALGNNMVCSDSGIIVSPEFEKDAVEQIKKAMGLPTIVSKIADLDIVGSLAKLNSKGFCLAHQDIEPFEKKLIEKQLGVICTEGTVNMGSPYVSSGILTNKNGFVIGSMSGGPEIDNADKALGFLQE